MKLFIDTANVEEIRTANDLGVIQGVTTNPSLIAKEGKDFIEVIKEITGIVSGPVSAEVVANDAAGMVAEAEKLSSLSENIVIKIPITAEGLKAVKVLSSKNIKTNVTLVFSASQALLAARAGATYVSPFVGRLNDISSDGDALISTISEIFSLHGITTEIIAASIRSPEDVVISARCGADIATVPYKIIMQMIKHPLTDSGIERFMKDWNEAFGK